MPLNGQYIPAGKIVRSMIAELPHANVFHSIFPL
jgi:hypothetical protein